MSEEINTNPDKETLDALSKDPINWTRWGFYYNTKDKRLFPPMRWTVFLRTANYANPYSILVNGVIVISFIILIVRFLLS